MITTNLTGNFGNHMWYYTICRLVAEKLGYEWGINPVTTHDYFGGQSQLYFMDINYGKEVVVSGKNERGLNTYVGITNEYYDFPKQHNYNGDGCVINMYDPNVFNIADNTMIHLISQSEDYLIDRKEDIWGKIYCFSRKLNGCNFCKKDCPKIKHSAFPRSQKRQAARRNQIVHLRPGIWNSYPRNSYRCGETQLECNDT